MKILLIAGGWSTEREISLKGAKNIEKALVEAGHTVTQFDILENFDRLCETAVKYDFAFINLHGKPGEDGLVQAMLDAAGCPYQGSGAAASFLALNKAASKQLFRMHDIPTSNWELLVEMPDYPYSPKLKFPLFVKSNTGGSSLRLAKVQTKEELQKILGSIFEAGEEALIEELIPGREVTCGILGSEALPPILIEPVAGDFFDFASKYEKNASREICPAPIGPEATAKVMELALRAHRVLGLEGYSRSDFIMEPGGRFIILETNTLPGMTGTSLLPQEAGAAGISFQKLLEKLIQLGLESARRRKICVSDS